MLENIPFKAAFQLNVLYCILFFYAITVILMFLICPATPALPQAMPVGLSVSLDHKYLFFG